MSQTVTAAQQEVLLGQCNGSVTRIELLLEKLCSAGVPIQNIIPGIKTGANGQPRRRTLELQRQLRATTR